MKYWVLRNNLCCTVKETFIFKTKKELREFWQRELNNNSDFYDFCTYSKKRILKTARSLNEINNINSQL